MRLFSILLVLFFSFTSYSNSLYCVDALTQYFNSSRPFNSIEEKKTLTVATFNLQDFRYYDLIYKGKNYRHENFDPISDRDYYRIESIANALINMNADIVSLQEVVKVESAIRFNNLFLDSEYEVFYTEADFNSGEGSVNVTLVRRNLLDFLEVEVVSHLSTTWYDPIKKESRKLFLRDALELRFYEKGNENKGPLFIAINNHLKSKRDRFGDPNSEMLRNKQMQALSSITYGLQRKFGDDVPILNMGDFNGDFNGSHEMDVLLSNGFSNVLLQYADKDPENWYTYLYISKDGETKSFQQMDAILASKSMVDVIVSSEVWPFFKDFGKEYNQPVSKTQLSSRPSDHRPVAVTFDLKKLRDDRTQREIDSVKANRSNRKSN